jgi:hypothetical protein
MFVATMASGVKQAFAQASPYDVGVVEALTTGDKVQWHGYYEFEYVDEDGKNSTYDAHKITVWMGVKLSEIAFLSSEVEYEHFPRLDNGDAAPGGSGEIKVDSAQLRLTPMAGTTGYFGIFYAPFGIEYLSYPGQKNKLNSRPKVMKSGGIVPGTWSVVGLGLTQVVNGFGTLDVYSINGDAKNGGISRDSKSGGNDSKSIAARVMFDQFAEGINIGGSYITGKYDVDDEFESTRVGAHIRFDSDIMTGISTAPVLIAEYVTGTDEMDSSVEGEDRDMMGYYVQLSSRVLPSIEIAARYGLYDSDEKKTDNEKTETSLGVTWYMTEGVLLKGEYQWNGEEGTEKDNDKAILELVAYW